MQRKFKKMFVTAKKFDLHLTVSKYSFFEERIEFLAHIIVYNRVQKYLSKVKSILNIPSPTSVEEFRRFLSMLTYLPFA